MGLWRSGGGGGLAGKEGDEIEKGGVLLILFQLEF